MLTALHRCTMGSVHTLQMKVLGSETEIVSVFSCCTRGLTPAAATAETVRAAAVPPAAAGAADGAHAGPLQKAPGRREGASISLYT